MFLRKFWISRKGAVYGPYRESQIKQYMVDGLIDGCDLIWNIEKKKWLPVKNYYFHKSTFMSQKSNVDDSDMQALLDFDIELTDGGFTTCIIHPIVCKGILPHDPNFSRVVEKFEMPRDSGFICEAPEDALRRGNLDRWLLKEPRALFRRDKDEASGEIPSKSPRVGWVKWVQNKFEMENSPERWISPSGIHFQDCEIGLLDSKKTRLKIIPSKIKIESFAFVSKMGVILLITKIKPSKISLREAMRLNYHLAHSENHGLIPVLVPKEVRKMRFLSSALEEEFENSEDYSYSVPLDHAEKCLKLWPLGEKKNDEQQDDLISWGEDNQKIKLESFNHLIKEDIIKQLSKEYGKEIQTYGTSRGRSHLYSNYLLPENHALSSVQLEWLEGLCAQCMRHPATSQIVPLPVKALISKEFQKLNITGSQRSYLSCEGAVSFGVAETGYSTEWQNRWSNDYVLCHLIAYHQSILCQELSWSSYTRPSVEQGNTEEIRNLKDLSDRYIEFCTHYDFSMISTQRKHQMIYRVSREVLGVVDSIKEVADEIESRLSKARNEFQDNLSEKQDAFNSLAVISSKKQEAFNSLAVIFFLLGCSTFLINLNITLFSEDAVVAWDFHGDSLGQKLQSLWFWGPIGISFLSLLHPTIRRHFSQVLKLLFSKSDHQ